MKRFIFYTTTISIIFYFYNKKEEQKKLKDVPSTQKTRVIKAKSSKAGKETKLIKRRKYNPDESEKSKELKKKIPYNLNKFVTMHMKETKWQRVLSKGEQSELKKLNNNKIRNEEFGDEEEFLIDKLSKKDILRAILYRKTSLIRNPVQKQERNSVSNNRRDDYNSEDDPYEKLLKEREEEDRKREAEIRREAELYDNQYKDDYQDEYHQQDDYQREPEQDPELYKDEPVYNDQEVRNDVQDTIDNYENYN